LALEDYVGEGSFGITLPDALQDRATRNTIRRVHLSTGDSELLNSILSSLTVDCEGFQFNSMESFILLNNSDTLVNMSDFFDRYYFPNLRHLELTNYAITRMDCLMSRTGALTTLVLDSTFPFPAPTKLELLSVLVSNPNLRKVSLSVRPDPSYGDNGSPIRVSLHSLKELNLSGDVRDIVGILHRLDHPSKLDLQISLSNCAVVDISQVIRPYLRDYVGRRGMPQHGVGLYVSKDGNTIGHNIGDVGNLDPSTPPLDRVSWFAFIEIHLNITPPKDSLERAILDLLTHTPREEVVDLQVFEEPITMEAISTQFPNLRALRFWGTPLPSTILNLGGDGEIFPALRHLFLDQVAVYDCDWSPLIASLARRASSGNRLDALEISGSSHMCAEVVEEIRSMVRHFRTEDAEMQLSCPFGTCPNS